MIIVLLPTCTLTSQIPTKQESMLPTPQKKENEKIKVFAKKVSKQVTPTKSVFITFKDGTKINPNTFFDDNKEAFGLKKDDKLILEKTSERGLFYSQYYKGIKVHGGYYGFSLNTDETVYSATGRIIENLNINTIPLIKENEALNIALDSIDASLYCWQDKEFEKKWKDNHDSKQGCYPIAKYLIRKPIHASFESKKFELNYVFEILTISPEMLKYTVHVNAHTGKITFLHDNLAHDCDPGIVNTIFNGTQDFNIEELTTGDFALFDYCNNIFTKRSTDWNNVTDCPDVVDCPITDPNSGNWDNETTKRQAATAHWAAQKAWEYFNSWHGVHGAENLHISTDKFFDVCPNPNYGKSIQFPNTGILSLPQDGNGDCKFGIELVWHDMVTLEILGHEFTHGVDIFNGKDLVNSTVASEINSICESISDIFGAIITINQTGNYNWVVNQFVVDETYSMRSLESPNDFGYTYYLNSQGGLNAKLGQPDFYQQADYWYPLNLTLDTYPLTGVVNHWFYLLANGGENGVWEDTNGNGFQDSNEPTTFYQVDQIAYENIAEILFHVLVDGDGLQMEDGFIEFAKKVVNKTATIFGDDSFEICNVIKAFNAVNLYPEHPGDCSNFNLSIEYIVENSDVPKCYDYTIIASTEGGSGCFNYEWELSLDGGNTFNPTGENNFEITLEELCEEPLISLTVTDELFNDCGATIQETLNDINDISKNYQFQLLNNPTSDKILIKYNFNKQGLYESSRFKMANVNGIETMTLPIRNLNGIIEVNVQDIPSGIYFVTLEVENTIIEAKKLLKL